MAETPNKDAAPRTILVVTDTPEDVQVIRSEIGERDYRLIQSWDLEDALARVREDAPELILLDVGAPGSEGAELCRRLRAEPSTEAVPVILIAEPGQIELETMLAVGADGIVNRPIHRTELTSRIRTLLRLRDLAGKLAEQHRQALEANVRLDRLIQELQARNRELEQGMEMAFRLQEAMLPQKYPRVENISFNHKYAPADAIGGDFFQIEGMDDGGAAILVADVSGHGLRAALVTSIVKTVADYIDVNGKTPSDVLSDFNSRFRSVLGPMTPQIYATGVLMMVDGKNRRIRLSAAGHPCPLLVSKRRMTAEPLMTLEEGGPALGFVPDPQFPTVSRQLEVGDIVLAYTDGAYEVLSPGPDSKMFGLKRLQQLVASNAHLIPRDLIERIIRETDEWMGARKRPDDVCLIAMEVH